MNFLLSFLFSFGGSLTPGTINLSAVQLGLDRKPHIAWRLGLAAAMVEYGYAWLAVVAAAFLMSSPTVIRHFQLIGSIVMLSLALLSFRAAARPNTFTKKMENSGFRRGLTLGILNPLAMPFWMGVTAYLKSQHWIKLDSTIQLHSYLAGVSAGVFTLLLLAAYLANKAAALVRHRSEQLKRIPAFMMLIMGCIGLFRYLVA